MTTTTTTPSTTTTSIFENHVWKLIRYQQHDDDDTKEKNTNLDPIIKNRIKDSIIFYNNNNTTTTSTTSSSSSSSSSLSLPLIQFIRKYTNLPFSTYPIISNHSSTTGSTTTTSSTSASSTISSTKHITVLQVSISELYDILGMIRALQYDLTLYNSSIKEEEEEVVVVSSSSSSSSISSMMDAQNRKRYQQYRFLQQIQQCCPRIRPSSDSTTTTSNITNSKQATIDGLIELLYLLEEYYYTFEIQMARKCLSLQQPNHSNHCEIMFDHPPYNNNNDNNDNNTNHPTTIYDDYCTMMEYCRPGTILIDTGIITGCSHNNNNTPMAVRCRSNRYRRSKTISGRIVSTHETSVEYIIAIGRPSQNSSSQNNNNNQPQPQEQPHYAIVETIWVQSEFEQTRNVQYNNNNNNMNNPYGMLLYPTLSSLILDEIKQRGLRYQSYCYNQQNQNHVTSSSSYSSGVFVQYQPGTFHPCHGTVRSTSSSSLSQPHQPSRVGGRMMIDIYQSYIRGIHICKPPADGIGTDIILPTFQSYIRYLRRSTTTTNTNTNNTTTSMDTNGPEDILVLYGTKIIDEMICLTWPVVCGFSFETRNWGVVYVDGITPIVFQDTIFDTALVLSTTRKRLLRAIVTCHGTHRYGTTTTNNNTNRIPSEKEATSPSTTTTNDHHPNTASADVLPGKGEGLIILLYGPPGVGKTLTAEAIAELLRRPLYRVSMGELGTTPEHLEEQLQNIFDLCIPWQALVLIDEAELLLQTRASNEILRNAMVCVMLRLLEYYPGILFLTTNNGIEQLDPAIASRITVALEYHAFDMTSRKEIWRSSISRVLNSTTVVSDDDDDNSSLPDNILSDDNLTTLATKYDKLNGRQIKNAVQLASIVCQYEMQSLTLKSIQDVLEMTVSSALSTSTT